jgi:hypothetical protein
MVVVDLVMNSWLGVKGIGGGAERGKERTRWGKTFANRKERKKVWREKKRSKFKQVRFFFQLLS